MERITSLQNPLVKEYVKLKAPAHRRERGLFLIEGVKLCREALACGLAVRYCFFTDDPTVSALTDRLPQEICILTTDAVIEKLSEAKNPQRIVMVAAIPPHSPQEISGRTVLALDGISDPANLGSILRTAEAFGVTDVICSDHTVDLYGTKALRGAMGSSFRVRAHRLELESILPVLHGRGYRLLATGLDPSAKKLQDIDFSEKTVVVIGNEGSGVRDEIFALCDGVMTIPMAGKNESLNAAAATAVVLWQAYGGRSDA